MRTKRTSGRLIAATVLVTGLLVPCVATLPAAAASGPNLAAGKTVTVSSSRGGFSTASAASTLNDGNQASYWESASTTAPQWAQIDLGTITRIGEVVLKTPGGWSPRSQTLSVQGSNDGVGFETIVISAARTFNPTATIKFPATNTRFVRVAFTGNRSAAQLSEFEIYGAGISAVNLALNKPTSASGHTQTYVAANAVDGNQATYWESVNHAFPQWIQVDLGSSVAVNQVVLKLPAGWGSRTQTLSVQGSINGSTFTTIVASAGRVFNPTSGNAVTISFNTATTRYVRIHVTANTGWPAGQLSELEIYGPDTGDTQAPTAPTNLAYTQPASGQIRLTWNASSDNVGVTGYDIYANGSLRTSVGNVLVYTDSQPNTATVSYYVRAKDAAGNQSANSNTVTRTGTGGDTQAPTAPTNLAYTQPASGQIRLTWNASSDNVGVTGYDIYANGSLRTSVGNVLVYTDSQPNTATVSYYVRAKDAAGNQSANSNTVTRTGSGGGSNLALGKPITSSGHVFTFVPTNANDGNLTTYWEGGGAYPQTLTVQLGSNGSLNQVVVKLNPDGVWGTRTQNIQVLGREQSASGFTNLVSAANYTFNPASGNTVTIPVSGSVADVRLQFNSNTGAPGGQVAELQVIGTPAPNPDLTITGASWTPASPVETDSVTLSATVRNAGSAGSGATNVKFYLGGTTAVGTANVGALAAGAQATVSVNVGPRNAGTYPLVAKVDEANTVVEQNETNNTYTHSSSLVVRPVDSSDLVASPVSWSPNNPPPNSTVNFSVAIKNQGTIASASGAHGITLTVLNQTGGTVITRTGSFSGTIAAGATTAPVSLGSWTAVNGRYTVRVVIANDANELPVKQGNNTSDSPLFIGRGASMPYDMYEAEDGQTGGGANAVGPNRTIGDPAGEASGRRAVTLASTGSFVQWTTRASTNTLVTRFSIPDSSGGGGTTSNLSIYVNGSLHKTITLNSRYAWLYGAEASPGNSPGAGAPRHIYDEANIMLNSTIPAGSTIKLQRDSGQGVATIDFVNLELVSPRANPDPARYKVPAGFSHQDVQNALDAARQDTNSLGVYLPAGTYPTSQKFQIYGKAVNVIGAGMWYTRFETPQSQENTDAGFRVETSANGSRFEDLAFFGNYTSRIDGPGKVWGELMNNQNLTINRTWVEHTICAYWGVHNNNITITNSRFRNTFADAVNFTNDTTNSLVSNNEGRGNGDDAFALFSATDAGGSVGNNGNVFENLSATLTWRAAGVAVYGGFNNVFRNLYIADQLVYSGLTVSSLNFGYPFVGFGPGITRFENISLVRSGGHFWGNQTFGAIWCFAATHSFRALRFTDIDIVDPTYSGIMFQTKYPEQTPVTDTTFTNVSISGALKSGDAFDAKSGFGIWANEMPEAGQGPAIGSATFVNLRFSNNHTNIRNVTTTFTLNIS